MVRGQCVPVPAPRASAAQRRGNRAARLGNPSRSPVAGGEGGTGAGVGGGRASCPTRRWCGPSLLIGSPHPPPHRGWGLSVRSSRVSVTSAQACALGERRVVRRKVGVGETPCAHSLPSPIPLGSWDPRPLSAAVTPPTRGTGTWGQLVRSAPRTCGGRGLREPVFSRLPKPFLVSSEEPHSLRVDRAEMSLPVKVLEEEAGCCAASRPREPPGVCSSHRKHGGQETPRSWTGREGGTLQEPTAGPLQIGGLRGPCRGGGAQREPAPPTSPLPSTCLPPPGPGQPPGRGRKAAFSLLFS